MANRSPQRGGVCARRAKLVTGVPAAACSAIALAVAAEPASAGFAQTYRVTGTADTPLSENAELCGEIPACTLRAALEEARNLVAIGVEAVVIELPAGEFTLAAKHGPLVIGNTGKPCIGGVPCPITIRAPAPGGRSSAATANTSS